MKEFATRLLCAFGFSRLARRQHRGRLAILMFHGVEPEPLSPPCWHVLDAPTLRRQLTYVRRVFSVLPLEDALERMRRGALPAHAAVITFDDGTQNLLTQAAPILRDLGLPAAVFLATGPMGTGEALWPDRLWLAFARTERSEADLTPLGLGRHPLGDDTRRGAAYAAAVHRLKELPDAERTGRLAELLEMLAADLTDPGPFRMLSWDEAHRLTRDADVTLYPHTATHPILSRCSQDKLEREIAESCAMIEHETGCAPAVFAYPNGRAQDFDERAKAALRRRGVRWALSTNPGFADGSSDPLALPRIGIGSDLSPARFRLLVSGVLG